MPRTQAQLFKINFTKRQVQHAKNKGRLYYFYAVVDDCFYRIGQMQGMRYYVQANAQ